MLGWTVGFAALVACSDSATPQKTASGPLNLIDGLEQASVSPDFVEIDFGTPDSRQYLGHGWARNGNSPNRDFVWGLGSSSQVRVPLSQPGNVAVTFQARPFGGFELEGQTVTLVANEKTFGTIPLDDGWSQYTVVAPEGTFHDGENTLELQYAWSAVPSDYSESDDRRSLSVAFDRISFDPDATTPGRSDDRPRPASVDFGTAASKALLKSGWGGREHGPKGVSYAWVTKKTAKLSLDLGHPSPSTLSLRARPFAYPNGPTQTLDLVVNGTQTSTWQLEEGWHEYTAELPASAFRSGRNTVALTFGHATSPSAVGTGNDKRKLAAALDWMTINPLVSPTIQANDQLHLALGIRTAYMLNLPAGSTLHVEMVDQTSSLVVELKNMRNGRIRSWSLDQSGEIQLSNPNTPSRVVQLSLIARRGEQASSLLLSRLTIETPDGAAPSFIGLRPRTQASEGDLPASP
ncbi:MAG: hypothetical protein CL927_14535 [Deltaproteobacteria bacterium]|nr:hypothetical protein [Deltaproteobacteria bacterium]HCH63825.1 hypothetical protein [Deltaproteobacteria bacterium]